MPRRLLPEAGTQQYVHLMSRTCSKTKFFKDDINKLKFVNMMRRTEEFSGCRVLAYAIMPNHFHILLHAPQRQEITDKELFRRIRILYGSKYYHNLRAAIADKRRESKDEKAFQLWWQPVRKKYTDRMYSVPAYMKTLKQRYARWFNRVYDRDGVFWGQPYKSVLIEDMQGVMFNMSTYIENNPVRKRLVKLAQDYEFSSLGAAVRGHRKSQAAIIDLVNLVSGNGHRLKAKDMSRKEFRLRWIEAINWYMGYTFVAGKEVKDESGKVVKYGYTHEQIQEVLKKRGRISFTETLHSRVRYMTYGVVCGSKEFCSNFMEMFPDRFSQRLRKNGVRMRKVGFNNIYTGRDLQLNAVTAPDDPPIREGKKKLI